MKEKKETIPKKEPVTLKWGSGKTSLLERNTVQSSLLQKSGSESEETKKENEKDDSKEDTEKEDIVFQVKYVFVVFIIDACKSIFIRR